MRYSKRYSKSHSVSNLIPKVSLIISLIISLCVMLIGGLFLSAPSHGQTNPPQGTPTSTSDDAPKKVDIKTDATQAAPSTGTPILFVMGGVIVVLLIVIGVGYWKVSRAHQQKPDSGNNSDNNKLTPDAASANSRVEPTRSTAYSEVRNQASPQPASTASSIPIIAPVVLRSTTASNAAKNQSKSGEETAADFSGTLPAVSDLTAPSGGDVQRIRDLEAELAGRFQEVKDLKAEVVRLTAELASALNTPTPQQSREIDALTVRLKQAETDCALERAKYNDEFATNQRLSGALEAQLKTMNGLTDPAEMRAYLVPRPDLPETIQVFARDLYLLWDRVKTGAANDRAFLVSSDGLRMIDSYVYSAPATYGRLAQEKNGQNLRIEDMLRITTLQKELHGALQKLGITPIIPGQGDTFDPKRHDADEADTVWVQDQSLHNTIVTVKRSGYADGDRVLRRAQVKRRLCGTPDLASTNNPVDYATKLQDLEEARRELEDNLNQHKAENLNLKQELANLRDEMPSLRQQTESPTAAQDALGARRSMEAEFSPQIQRLQAENAALLGQVQSAQQNQTRVQELQTEILNLRAQIDMQNRARAAAQAAIALEIEARANERIERVQIDNDVLRRQLQAAISAQTEIESKTQFELQTRINAQARAESLQKEIDALRDQMTALTAAQSRPTLSVPYQASVPEPPVTLSSPPTAPIALPTQTDDEDLLGTAG